MNAHREAAYPPGTWRCGPGPCDHGASPVSCRRLAESERAQERGVILPLFDGLSHDDQDRVVEALRRACDRR
jgi:dTDP-4-amino-4,6-dideoxygalactose transaminase